MPKRISAAVDMAILRDIGLGFKNNIEIAAEYGVSASYVSKLKTGKKVPDVYVSDVRPIIPGLSDTNVMIEFYAHKVADTKHALRVYEETLKRLKENKHG